MAARAYLLFWEDMQEAMERIGRYCAGLDFAGFCANELVVDGVIRNLEVIGEAAKKVPVAVQQLYPQLLWSQMYRMRNRISHEYFGLDLATIWRVATAHPPQNYPDLLLVLAAERARPQQGSA
ncbi:DUF86 domain-containing protein [Hymenobacter sp. BRD128]|uniref:HepT-like ribonuclease domain-containing protein n=1 Tax=Hymenobacter sp. BRD128 TaxID=2675878 RepID=UPI001562F1EC|nr:DUF86 domain-containing protein [Hymenobacter sp. BRD128]QKG57296.1 DUF86 domain-containing protein [Hymenobacter sp. BRD128]